MPAGLATTQYKNAEGVHRDLVKRLLQIDCAMSAAAILTSKEGSSPYSLNGS